MSQLLICAITFGVFPHLWYIHYRTVEKCLKSDISAAANLKNVVGKLQSPFKNLRNMSQQKPKQHIQKAQHQKPIGWCSTSVVRLPSSSTHAYNLSVRPQNQVNLPSIQPSFQSLQYFPHFLVSSESQLCLLEDIVASLQPSCLHLLVV